jgi:hypothetical protein
MAKKGQGTILITGGALAMYPSADYLTVSVGKSTASFHRWWPSSHGRVLLGESAKGPADGAVTKAFDSIGSIPYLSLSR